VTCAVLEYEFIFFLSVVVDPILRKVLRPHQREVSACVQDCSHFEVL